MTMMKWFSCCRKHIVIDPFATELTEDEKYYTRKMCGLVERNTPFNEAFFNNMNKAQIQYLLSIIDEQDCMHSSIYATYVCKLRALAKKNDIRC